MKKIVRLTESDLSKIVSRVINEKDNSAIIKKKKKECIELLNKIMSSVENHSKKDELGIIFYSEIIRDLEKLINHNEI
jgi:hypothetical protein